MDADHFVVTSREPVWRRSAGRNGQHAIAYYATVGAPVPAVLLVTGYNIMSDDAFMLELVEEFPSTPIIFNSQMGVRPPGSEDREGPGWRLVVSCDNDDSPLAVPFDDLADSGIALY